MVSAVVRRPALWGAALRQWRRTTPSGWWRRAPFLPLPSREYAHFRLVTQYGRNDAPVVPADVVNYLMWCKEQDRVA